MHEARPAARRGAVRIGEFCTRTHLLACDPCCVGRRVAGRDTAADRGSEQGGYQEGSESEFCHRDATMTLAGEDGNKLVRTFRSAIEHIP